MRFYGSKNSVTDNLSCSKEYSSTIQSISSKKSINTSKIDSVKQTSFLMNSSLNNYFPFNQSL